MTRPDRLSALPKHRLLCEFSLWSADLVRLADDVARADAHADVWHVDVADGHFAPSFLFFPDQVARVRELTDKPIHVHLMVADAILLDQIDQFVDAGADLVSVHLENDAALVPALDRLDDLGVAAGVVLKWDTPVAAVAPVLPRLAFLTLLGTAIGVKGQSLSPAATGRLGEARALIAAAGRPGGTVLAADGGIRDTTVPALRAAGADTVVMGSLAFGAPDLAARIAWAHGLPGPG
ncbi:ribulose-phosphate 3-epimerase [Oharaeibacter diazotrophicus]|uniref:Ribulose-5-phosphate 3-epimerase n=2 Tax=Oharaeibacter diazotrophicus TaxID=1920512 RepID=A0A4R6R8H7_9HYPH|nr:ribulose-phosphate 3-epimerase [Oharaeibacter diazotrophicus]TDP81886.1 ribulose-5-phosphate 3-epimerase [Oharaeibacter diazotrophicus]BBE73518.1 ribulose-phosphate 3-epimerase [Pleomorphomonas sp. SM30]GLS75307.1 D-allulose-6-phosphate 3-epimerase [Oharaeibacter diazotrophicus]